MEACPLSLHLFGAFEVQVHGRPLGRTRTRSVEWLLALLVLRSGREVSRSWLAGTFWPGSSEARSLLNLRRNLLELRRALGTEAGRLQAPRRDTLRLELGGAAADVVAFDAAIAAGDEGSLQEAVALYRGPLLEGCGEEWVFPERASRAEACLQALERLADRAAERGEAAAALGYLEQATALDPLRDSVQRRRMQTLTASGDLPAALHTYREHRLRLHRELNVEPDPETTQLFQALRSGARRGSVGSSEFGYPRSGPGTHGVGGESSGKVEAGSSSLPGPPLSTLHSPLSTVAPLPRPLTALIGREQEVPEVVERVRACRLVTLVGGGGVGKTRLAIQAAAELAPDFPEGVAFIELAALAEAALLPAHVAAALGVRETEAEAGAAPEAMVRALCAGLTRHPLLLVLDNCEHLIAAATALIHALLSACPDLRILTTSRQRLGLTGEVVRRVPSLPAPDPERLPADERGAIAAVLSYPAVQLLVERAAAVRPEFPVENREEAVALARICQRLDGIPLALELAAARVGLLTLPQIAARLDDRFHLLTGGSRASLPRHQTLHALIDWSYDLLPEAERTLFGRLSVFAGGWTLEAAEAVCGGEGVRCSVFGLWSSDQPSPSRTPNTEHRTPNTEHRTPNPDVLDLLGGLEEKSLVQVELREGAIRYRMLETVREYGRERLAESGEADAIRRRHAAFFLALAERGARGISEPEQMDRLEREHDNLRAALAWCKEPVGSRQWGAGPRGEAVRGSADPSGKTDPPLSKLTPDRVPAERVVPLLTAVEMGLRLGGALAQFWNTRGYWTEGRGHLAELLALPEGASTLPSGGTRRSGGPARTPARGRALNGAGAMAYEQGHLGAAWELYQESLAIFRALDDKVGAAMSLRGLGSVAHARSDYGAARALAGESLAIFRELGDEGAIADSLRTIAVAAKSQGDHEAARALLEESLAIQRERGDTHGLASTLNSLGELVRELEEYGAARELFEESLAIFREVGNRYSMVHSLVNLAGAALAQGDAETARARLEEGEAVVRGIEDRRARIHPLGALGHLARHLGDDRRAAALYQESLLLRRDVGDQYALAQSLEDLGSLAGNQQRWKRAARLLGAAEAACTNLGATPPVAVAAEYGRTISGARSALGEAAFAAAWAEGRAMSLDEAVGYALGEE